MKGEILIKELTSKEKLFCAYYSAGRNPREAAIKAGYSFGERTALRLLRKKEIEKELARLDKQKRTDNREIATGCRRLAFGCVSDAVALLFSEEVTKNELEKMDLFNISEIKRKKGGDIEIKFFDRLKALELMREISSSDKTGETSSIFSAIEKGAKALSDKNEQ